MLLWLSGRVLRLFCSLSVAVALLETTIDTNGDTSRRLCFPDEKVHVTLSNNRSAPTEVWWFPPSGGGQRNPRALEPGASLSVNVLCNSLFAFVIPPPDSESVGPSSPIPPDGTVLRRVPVTQGFAQAITISRPALEDVTAHLFRLRRYGQTPEYAPGRNFAVQRGPTARAAAAASASAWLARSVRAGEDGFDDSECEIPRVRLRDVSARAFRAQCIEAGRPCLLQLSGRDVFGEAGGAEDDDDWTPPESWSRASFVASLGALPVRRTFGSDLSRAAFLANFESASERETLAEYLTGTLRRPEEERFRGAELVSHHGGHLDIKNPNG